MKKKKTLHKDLRERAIKNSYEKVSNIVDVFSVVKNPFEFLSENVGSDKMKLINIYNGVVMHDKDADCLSNAKEIGKKEIETFIEERLKSEDRNIFWNKQSKLNLPTFNSTKNIGKTTSNNSKFTIQIDKNNFPYFF